MNYNCDILNLEWDSHGRDIDIVEPVLTYIELFFGLKVVRESIWYGELKILKYKPKLLIISNSVGAENNARMFKFAYQLGIKTIALSSEGDSYISEIVNEGNFWGWNKDKICYEDLTLYWSQKAKCIAQQLVNTASFNIQVSGATGFDRYQFWAFMGKSELRRKYKLKQKKVIGIAVYPFEIYDGHGTCADNEGNFIDASNYEYSDILIRYREELNKIYDTLIRTNKDVLFVLKLHPAIAHKELSECKGLFEEENVLVLLKEENIADVINSCDMWLAFESTTCMEAWLLNKVTLFIDPLSTFFPRSKISDGAPRVKNYSELIGLINEFYKNNKCEQFDIMQGKRDEIIKSIIEHRDGKNHIRASNYIMEIYNKITTVNRNSVNCFILKYTIKEGLRGIIFNTPIKYFCRAKYLNYKQNINGYDKTERINIANLYSKYLDPFYKLKGTKIEE